MLMFLALAKFRFVCCGKLARRTKSRLLLGLGTGQRSHTFPLGSFGCDPPRSSFFPLRGVCLVVACDLIVQLPSPPTLFFQCMRPQHSGFFHSAKCAAILVFLRCRCRPTLRLGRMALSLFFGHARNPRPLFALAPFFFFARNALLLIAHTTRFQFGHAPRFGLASLAHSRFRRNPLTFAFCFFRQPFLFCDLTQPFLLGAFRCYALPFGFLGLAPLFCQNAHPLRFLCGALFRRASLLFFDPLALGRDPRLLFALALCPLRSGRFGSNNRRPRRSLALVGIHHSRRDEKVGSLPCVFLNEGRRFGRRRRFDHKFHVRVALHRLVGREHFYLVTLRMQFFYKRQRVFASTADDSSQRHVVRPVRLDDVQTSGSYLIPE